MDTISKPLKSLKISVVFLLKLIDISSDIYTNKRLND